MAHMQQCMACTWYQHAMCHHQTACTAGSHVPSASKHKILAANSACTFQQTQHAPCAEQVWSMHRPQLHWAMNQTWLHGSHAAMHGMYMVSACHVPPSNSMHCRITCTICTVVNSSTASLHLATACNMLHHDDCCPA